MDSYQSGTVWGPFGIHSTSPCLLGDLRRSSKPTGWSSEVGWVILSRLFIRSKSDNCLPLSLTRSLIIDVVTVAYVDDEPVEDNLVKFSKVKFGQNIEDEVWSS